MAREEPPATAEKSQQTEALEGLALAASFLVWAIACRFVPTWLGATRGQTTAWYVVGGLCGAIALGAGFTEAAKLTRAEFKSDFGAAAFLAVLAVGCFLAASQWHIRSPFDGALKGFGLFCGMFAVYGTFTGLAKVLDPANRRPTHGSRRSRNVGGIVAVVGFATAVVNFVAAIRK